MIYFDVTKVSAQKHHSGLVRVSGHLRTGLAAHTGAPLATVIWHARRKTWVVRETGQTLELQAGDWLLTPELFCEEERPGLEAWLARHGARAAAIYHDAIPLRFPHITWPQSVARHPGYMRLLSQFGRVFAISEASARELADYWAWMGLATRPGPTAITLGADGHTTTRAAEGPDRSRSRQVVMVGIVEPRKNQDAVLEAFLAATRERIDVSMTIVGRVNPHFGRPTARRMKELTRAGHALVHHESLDDRGVAALIASARFSVLASRAEGCGLPVLESLWAGLPVLATALPSVRESAVGGGCLLVPPDDLPALVDGLRSMLTDDALIRRLQVEACQRRLPRWGDTAAAVMAGLGGA